MFPFRWPNNSEPMWSPGWPSSPATPHQALNPQGQFCGGDLKYQQSQAQTQAQINALQQQNSLLNQQLHNQSMTHIQHLQQLVPHQQSQPTPTIPPPPLHQQPTPPIPVQPEPPTPTLTPPSQPPMSPSFNPEEMLNQMKQTLRADLVAAVEKANERSSQLFHPTPTTTPPTDGHNQPSNSQRPNTAQPSHRSRSPPRSREHPGDDKDLFLFPEAHDVALMFPAGHASQNPHHTGVETAQSRSCRCPLIVGVIAMTSTKMIVLVTAQQDAPLVLLNLRTLRHGTTMMGLQTTMTTPITQLTTATNPTGKTGTLGERGGLSHHLPPTHRGTSSPAPAIHGVIILSRILILPNLGMITTEIHLDLLPDCQQHHTPSPNCLWCTRRHSKNLQNPPSTVPDMNRNIIPGQPRQSRQVTSRCHSKMTPARNGSKRSVLA